jgi:hypothetical protein
LNEDPRFGAPRDVTPEELSRLFPEGSELDLQSSNRNWLETESGMGANEPILTDGDFEALDLPQPVSYPGASPAAIESGSAGLLVSQERIAQLWERIDGAQLDIPEKIPNLPIARQLIAELEQARSLMMDGIENYEEAESAISQVELRIAIAERSKADGRIAIALFLYELIWAIGLITFFLTVTGSNLTDQMILVQSAAWGGLGGIAGAFYALWKHVSRDVDFSKQYSLWYITNPIMGAVLGAFVFLVTKFGLISLSSGTSPIEITSPFVIYILAFVVGYQQNAAWDLMRRILKVFRIGDDEDQ